MVKLAGMMAPNNHEASTNTTRPNRSWLSRSELENMAATLTHLVIVLLPYELTQLKLTRGVTAMRRKHVNAMKYSVEASMNWKVRGKVVR